MTDLVYDYISMGVDMILTAAILSAIVVLLRSSVVLSSYQANLQANSDRMNYYKQFNMYDCTNTLCSADIISALVYYRYELSMVVVRSDGKALISNDPATGKFYKHDSDGNRLSEMSVSDITELLTAERTYNSYLVEDMADEPTKTNYRGGIVTGLKFEMRPVTP